MKDLNYYYKKYVPKKNHKSSIEKELIELMEFIFEYDKRLLLITFIGHTPSWNDGDPCYHSSYFEVLTTEGLIDPDGYLVESIEDDLDYDNDEDELLITEARAVPLIKPISTSVLEKEVKLDKKIESILNSQKLVDYIWDTNYMVKFYLTKEGVKVIGEYYESDY